MTALRRQNDVLNLVIGVLVAVASFFSARGFIHIDDRSALLEKKMDLMTEQIAKNNLRSERIIIQVQGRLIRLEEKVDPEHPQAPLGLGPALEQTNLMALKAGGKKCLDIPCSLF